MGKVSSIEALETYVEELGQEVKHVKKASTYLQEIEAQQLLVKEQLEQVKKNSEMLESVQSHFTEKTNEYESQMKKNEERMAQLNASVVELGRQINQLEKENEVLKKTIQQAEENQKQAAKRTQIITIVTAVLILIFVGVRPLLAM